MKFTPIEFGLVGALIAIAAVAGLNAYQPSNTMTDAQWAASLSDGIAAVAVCEGDSSCEQAWADLDALRSAYQAAAK